MQPRSLGLIQAGVSTGIEILQYRKHGRVDPSEYASAALLRRDTNPRGRGSKWLHTISEQEEFDLVVAVLESHGIVLGAMRGQFKGAPRANAVGVSNGNLVHSVQVEFDGRYAHGFPSEP